VIHREALYLDERRWDDWLALYHDDAEFWVPAWRGLGATERQRKRRQPRGMGKCGSRTPSGTGATL